MPKTISASGRRERQVKVNLSNSELKILDDLKVKLGSDKSSLLRESFFKYCNLIKEGRLIMKETTKIENIATKNYTPLYKNISELDMESRRISEYVTQFKDRNIINDSQYTQFIEQITNDLYKLNKNISVYRKLVDEADTAYDGPRTELNERLENLFNDSYIYDNQPKDNFLDDLTQKIVIFNINENNGIFDILDFFKDGIPIIIDIKDMNQKESDSSILEKIKVGAYALNIKNHPLNENLILFAPQNLLIEKIK